MAPHAKFFAVYDQPFWREAGLSGTAQSMVGPMPEIHDATTASGQAALFGFLGVGADQRAALGEDALTRACLDQLARLFGADARHPRATLFKDWAADPLTATAADRVATGHPVPDLAPWVSGPWQARLALAGSETSPSEPGYLAGAVVAAARAVADTVQKLGAGSDPA
jgi:monoamine oxidase